ncbi:MAG: FAD-dependent oxidoreductase [Acinetobacter pittii]|jgi:2-polyprenyl-6-methoxyphenol hydroxylase-like FAD-dependent oxidoreductase|nr:FAD-dependent oxidoreductase [Acinetobacter pittii]
MDQKQFKVVIVGGGIAGPTLALMLERNGIDFVVLEAYGSIAPQVGASFGVLPNGFRILDQLGCYESVLKMAEYPVDKFHFRDSQGQPFWTFDNFNETSIGRFVAFPSLSKQQDQLTARKTWLPCRFPRPTNVDRSPL